MCQGTTTLLKGCGHTFYHFTSRCTQNCTIPEGPQHTIEDCCASCDPDYRIATLRRDHMDEAYRLEQKIHFHLARGSWAELQATERKINALATELSRKISAVHLERVFSAPEVEWGVKKDWTSGLCSQWVGGRLVWSGRPMEVPSELRHPSFLMPQLEKVEGSVDMGDEQGLYCEEEERLLLEESDADNDEVEQAEGELIETERGDGMEELGDELGNIEFLSFSQLKLEDCDEPARYFDEDSEDGEDIWLKLADEQWDSETTVQH